MASSIPVTSGIPQGIVLGPLLFLIYIYINDLPEHVSNSRIRLFTDDCIIYKQILTPNDVDLLQEDVNSVVQWASLWQMRFNVTKYCYLQISSSQVHHFPSFMVPYYSTLTTANILA